MCICAGISACVYMKALMLSCACVYVYYVYVQVCIYICACICMWTCMCMHAFIESRTSRVRIYGLEFLVICYPAFLRTTRDKLVLFAKRLSGKYLQRRIWVKLSGSNLCLYEAPGTTWSIASAQAAD